MLPRAQTQQSPPRDRCPAPGPALCPVDSRSRVRSATLGRSRRRPSRVLSPPGSSIVISFDCTNCGKKLRVKDEFAGQTGQCPSCGQQMEIPNQDTDTAPPRPVYDVRSEDDTVPNEEHIPEAEPVGRTSGRASKQNQGAGAWEL